MIRSGMSAVQRFHIAARDAVLTRGFAGKQPSQIFDNAAQEFVAWKPTREMQYASLPRLAERCLIEAGIPRDQVERLSTTDIARLVMGANPMSVGIMVASDAAYNVTGMFSNIFYDASNVILRNSYNEARTTFQVWAKRGPDCTNFQLVNRVIAGEISDPRAIPEDGEFEESTMLDGKESYRLTVWGEKWSQSWQMIIGDNIGAFTDPPRKHGNAMRRKQNKLVYNALKDNPNLSDGGALFNTTARSSTGGHANLTGLHRCQRSIRCVRRWQFKRGWILR